MRATPLGTVEGVAYSESDALQQVRSDAASKGGNFVRIEDAVTHCVPRGHGRHGGVSRDCGYVKIRGTVFAVPADGDPPIDVVNVRVTIREGDRVEMDANRNVIVLSLGERTTPFELFGEKEDPRIDPIIARVLDEDVPAQSYQGARNTLGMVRAYCAEHGCKADAVARVLVALAVVDGQLGDDVAVRNELDRALHADPHAKIPKRNLTPRVRMAWNAAVLIARGQKRFAFMPGTATWKDDVIEGQLEATDPL